MAARRLLIVMVILLATSTLAAALVPVPEEQGADEERTTTPPAASVEADSGDREVVEAEVAAGAGRPREIRVDPGDQLSLTVTRSAPGPVTLPAFGLAGFAEPGAPARFDILIRRPGRFEVKAEGSGTVATIVASEARG